MNYKYHLQKYAGRNSRHECPNCGRHSFAYYVDESEEPLAPTVGRCDHTSSCCYHLTPREYLSEHPDKKQPPRQQKPIAPAQPKVIDYVPFVIVKRSEGHVNSLITFLMQYFDKDKIAASAQEYHLGTTKRGEVIFPQIDGNGNCRSGKVILYDGAGHRVKADNRIEADWLHSRYMKSQGLPTYNFHLKQCLFGEHLLAKHPDAVVGLTEGEKTAFICSMEFPDMVWVSVGGKQNFKPDMCAPLRHRNVIVYADADAVEEWKSKAQGIKCESLRFSQWWRDEAEGSKRDIADLIIEEKKCQAITIGKFCAMLKEVGIPKDRVSFNI